MRDGRPAVGRGGRRAHHVAGDLHGARLAAARRASRAGSAPRRRSPLMALTVAAGILLRLVPAVGALFAGTIVAGLGIALGNVLVPSLIKRDFPRPRGADDRRLHDGDQRQRRDRRGAHRPARGRDRARLARRRSPSGRCPRSSPPRCGCRGRRAARPTPAPRAARTPGAPSVARPARVAGDRVHGAAVAALLQRLSWLPALLRSEGIDRETAGALLSLMLLAAIPTCLLVPVFAARRPRPARGRRG